VIRGVYPILDLARVPAERARVTLEQLLEGGAKVVQLRAKTAAAGPLLTLASELAAICRAAGARFIVNDRPDVALLAGAGGVHLGQEDLLAPAVRRWLPTELVIGVSCHSIDQLSAAIEAGGADYLAYGPIFETRSKSRPDPTVGLAGLALARAKAGGRPLVAIGGITVDRVAAVRAAGADAVAMIAGLLDHGEVTARTREAVEAFEGR
jgi:thiamine-phosphate pyrophosphorylase